MKIIPVCRYDLNEVGRTILKKLERTDVRCTKDNLLELGFIFNEKLEIEETNGWVIVRTERLNIPFLKKLIEHMPYNVRVRWEHLNTAELTLKLRVGGVYKMRNGEIEELMADPNPSESYKYVGKINNKFYTENGRLLLFMHHPLDIVEEIQLPEYQTIWKKCEELKSLRKENAELREGLKNTLGRISETLIKESEASLKRCFALLDQKPESNPFKIGDKAIGYSLGSPHGDIVKGTVSEIDGDKILIDQEDYPADYNCNYWFHYKQCELVND